MATSGVTAWSLTARDIVTTALEENGIIRLGKSPTSAEMDACIRRLNGLLKSHPTGLHLETSADVTIPADTASGTLGGGVMEVLNARLVNSGGTERIIPRLERDDYLSLPNKSQPGAPTLFYVSYQRDAATLYVWPVPTAETTVKINYIRMPETVTAAGQTVDIPERYQEAIYSNLAVRCAGIFKAPIEPELAERAAMLWRKMEDDERPASYFLGPA